MLGVTTSPTCVIGFATQLTAPHMAHLWVPSTKRDVLLPAATFMAAAASAAAMLRNDKPHRRTALAGRQPASCQLLHALVLSAFVIQHLVRNTSVVIAVRQSNCVVCDQAHAVAPGAVCVGYLRIAAAALRTPGQPITLLVDAHPTGTCSISCRGQRLLTTSFAATRVGRPADGNRHADGGRQHRGQSLHGLLAAEGAATEHMNMALTERGSSNCWEASCHLDPTQLEAGLQLASCNPDAARATMLSQASAISVPATSSLRAYNMASGGGTSVSTALQAPGQAVTCQGVVLVSAGAHASTEQQAAAVPAPERVGPVSRRITGPAALSSLRGLPRTARLLRIEALVRYHPQHDCSAPQQAQGFGYLTIMTEPLVIHSCQGCCLCEVRSCS